MGTIQNAVNQSLTTAAIATYAADNSREARYKREQIEQGIAETTAAVKGNYEQGLEMHDQKIDKATGELNKINSSINAEQSKVNKAQEGLDTATANYNDAKFKQDNFGGDRRTKEYRRMKEQTGFLEHKMGEAQSTLTTSQNAYNEKVNGEKGLLAQSIDAKRKLRGFQTARDQLSLAQSIRLDQLKNINDDIKKKFATGGLLSLSGAIKEQQARGTKMKENSVEDVFNSYNISKEVGGNR